MLLSGAILLLGSACATPRLLAVSTPGVTTSPGGQFAYMEKEGLAIHVTHADTPYRLNRRITTFHLQLVNTTNYPIDFVPQPFLLFDQADHQYFALGPDALAEAVATGSAYRSSYSFGMGFGSWRGGSFSQYHFAYGGPFPYYEPPAYGWPYQSLVGAALPFHPITVYPGATVEGNVYFGIGAKYINTARLRLIRLDHLPTPASGAAREIVYEFSFNVMYK